MPSRTQHSTRPSPGCHVVAGFAINDDQLVFEPSGNDGTCGLSIKQVQPGIDVPRADLEKIKVGEKYYIWDTGEVDVVTPGGLAPVKGDKLYITIDGTNVVSKTSGAGKAKLGKVRYVGPERGLDADMMTVSFDARKDF